MEFKAFSLISLLLIAACGGGGDFSYNTPVGVFVSGLEAGKNVTLQLNDDDILSVSTNGKSTFTKPLPVGSSYKVTVHKQPPGFQWCNVVNGAGITGETTSYIDINCEAALGQVTTYAGKYRQRILAPENTPLENATFERPLSPVYDKEGNLYFIEQRSRVIRRISKDGILTTFAGKVGDGTFRRPNAMAFGPDGLLYVADDDRVVTIDSDGNIKNYAGDLNSFKSPNPYDPTQFTKHRDGPKDGAFFYQLGGIAVDSQGNVFLSDNINYVIRRIDKLSGMVTTIGGFVGLHADISQDGDAKNATFGDLFSLAVDAKDNVYVVDYNGIRKITPAGIVSTYHGRINYSRSIAVDAYGALYIGGILNLPRISRIPPSGGAATLVAGGKLSGRDDGIGDAARFDYIRLTIAPDGSILVADDFGSTFRKVVPAIAPNRP